MDFRKKHRLSSGDSVPIGGHQDDRIGQDGFKKEYKSARDALGEFSPFRWRQQWLQIRNFTPEECETLEDSLCELKTNIKCYTTLAFASFLAFNFWQRRYLPRKFYFFSFGVSVMAGTLAACVKTSWYYVEQMDKLGQEYELSRAMKQDIFDTRPDMSTAMRAQYYQH